MKTVVLITNIPTPYRIPLFNLLNEEMNEKGWMLHVIFSSKGYKRRKFEINEADFKFKYTILDGNKVSIGEDAEKTYFLYNGLRKALQAIKPWRIIVSGFSPATSMAAYWKFVYKTPFIIWSGTIENTSRKTSLLRSIYRKALIKQAAAYIVYGSRARAYMEHKGASPQKIHVAINTVDTRFFKAETEKWRNTVAPETKFTFLYIGYLVPRKNVGKVIEAAAILARTRRDFCIQIIGDGVSKKELMDGVSTEKLEDIITFTGYKQREELPAYLAKADALLFQTDFDIWGLVLNEAMAAGLACLSTTNAGATTDLIDDGVNGYINRYEDSEKTAAKMAWMIDHRQLVQEAGNKAAEFIATKAGLKQSVEGFMKAIQSSNE